MSMSGYNAQRRINDHYDIIGFISSGTYGRVYKAKSKIGRGLQPPSNSRDGPNSVIGERQIELFAIKK